TKQQAADAAGMVDVDYEVLPAVTDVFQAPEGNVKTHTDLPDNICWDLTYSPSADEAFAEADVVVKERIHQQRLSPNPMEPRGVIAEWEAGGESLTIWISSQNPHFVRLFMAGAVGLPESKIRVISPDVGGGFGSKISMYSED